MASVLVTFLEFRVFVANKIRKEPKRGKNPLAGIEYSSTDPQSLGQYDIHWDYVQDSGMIMDWFVFLLPVLLWWSTSRAHRGCFMIFHHSHGSLAIIADLNVKFSSWLVAHQQSSLVKTDINASAGKWPIACTNMAIGGVDAKFTMIYRWVPVQPHKNPRKQRTLLKWRFKNWLVVEPPIWKICSSNWVHLPQIVVKIRKLLSCHLWPKLLGDKLIPPLIGNPYIGYIYIYVCICIYICIYIFILYQPPPRKSLNPNGPILAAVFASGHAANAAAPKDSTWVILFTPKPAGF